VDAIFESVAHAVEELLGRASGPFHLRLVFQPIVASVLAIRAGLKDARRGQPPFFWTIMTDPAHRETFLKSGWKDIGKLFVIALILDTLYQVIALHAFHLVQTLVVAVGVSVIPYTVLRGPVTRIARPRGAGRP
jgi:hypothetical protein